MMESFVNACGYETGYDDYGEKMKIPEGSRIITSDDIFEYMLAARSGNDEIESSKEEAKEDWAVLKYGKGLRFTGMDDYEDLRLQNLARSRSVSRRKYLKKTLGEEVRLASNGETALLYFEKKLESDTLYCLDEPENSMSPRMQLELKKLLETQVRFCGCQLIVATHSPFLLSMQGARIYDLDETPVDIRNWWELENVRIYYDFFKENRELFED
jgi:predicted ATPase